VLRRLRPWLPVLLLALWWTPAAPAETGQQPATWQMHEVTLDYMGFTTRYSCDGLRDKLRWVLNALGARADSRVERSGCTRLGEPERLPSVKITAWTLQAAAAPAQPGAIDATWKAVNLAAFGGLDRGDCELAEAIRKTVLPLFTVRAMQYSTSCIPHQETAGAVTFRLEALVPAAAPPQ